LGTLCGIDGERLKGWTAQIIRKSKIRLIGLVHGANIYQLAN